MNLRRKLEKFFELYQKFSQNFVRISQKCFIENVSQKIRIFDESSKFVRILSKIFRKIGFEFRENGFSKIFEKMIEIFVFEPHFRMAYRNFAKEIERKFGNPYSGGVISIIFFHFIYNYHEV